MQEKGGVDPSSLCSSSVFVQVGFFTGKKRESIFKSPEDVNGKVGVIGSGRGITEFQKREKYLANRSDTNIDE